MTIFPLALVWILWLFFFLVKLFLKLLINFSKSLGLMKYSGLKYVVLLTKKGTRKSINILFMKERFHSSINLSLSGSPSMPTFVCCMALLFRASDCEYLGFSLFSVFCLFTVNYFSSWVAWEQEKFSFHYPLLQMKDRLSYCI